MPWGVVRDIEIKDSFTKFLVYDILISMAGNTFKNILVCLNVDESVAMEYMVALVIMMGYVVYSNYLFKTKPSVSSFMRFVLVWILSTMFEAAGLNALSWVADVSKVLGFCANVVVVAVTFLLSYECLRGFAFKEEKRF